MPEKKEPAEKLIDKMEAFADSLHREQEFKDFPFRIERDDRGGFHSLTVRAPKGETVGKMFRKTRYVDE